MAMTILPRACYLTEAMPVGDLRPLPFAAELIAQLPPALTALTGAIHRTRLPPQGLCNLLVQLEAERGSFALKVARGGYRTQELGAEHTVMQLLHGGPVPVPASLAFVQQGELSFQLRAYIPGQPLSAVLAASETPRRDAIRQMGQTLAAIHRVRPGLQWTWEQWLEASLERAALNLATGACDDPEEFTADRPAPVVLEWLRANRPAVGSVCLLHGDYRPKNLLWQDGRVVSVIDWAFVDVGDPYYDLSIVRWYMRDEAEWAQFLAAYGLNAIDQQRFAYCLALHKFLNV